jgi:hypothetical protein
LKALTIDDLAKSPIYSLFVIPAKLVLDLIGEQESSDFRFLWTPAFAGVTLFLAFYEAVTIN